MALYRFTLHVLVNGESPTKAFSTVHSKLEQQGLRIEDEVEFDKLSDTDQLISLIKPLQ